MVEVDNRMKLLFSAFIIILLGVVLIQPIADDIEKVKTGSITVLNETLNFVSVTAVISNESQANIGNETIPSTYTTTFDDLTVITEIRNESATIVTSDCNETLLSGVFNCNATNSTNLFFDYTYISGRTDTLANDELISLDALRNITSENILGFCNVTLASGDLVCNNTYSATGFADYKYTPDNFVRSSTARTLLTLTILFFALFVLAMGIIFTVRSFKDGKIM